MRFDDSLTTILSADMQPGVGAQSAWRQLVDLMSRGRIPADEPTIARLRLLRQAVPDAVRAASARAVAFATPGPALVGFFAEDSLAVAAPVLRTAILAANDWLAILPRLGPETRSILRHRRDLPDEVVRGLESFGATDFVLAGTPHDVATVAVAAPPTPAPDTPRSATPFVSLGDVARGLPVIAEAFRREGRDGAGDSADAGPKPGFPIADLVARIDAFRRQRDERDPQPIVAAPATAFHYETDRDGTICWVDGVARGPLIGVSLARAVRQGETEVDAAASGAIRQRGSFARARLIIGGTSDAAGSWRIAGEPMFDAATGRFTGYRGIARRPRIDESAARPDPAGAVRSESLRQLVHELRTPANAIAGFAELIETQLLGPVVPSYRNHASTIRRQAGALIAAIDDLDTLARIDGSALEQRPATLALQPLLARVVAELTPLAEVRCARIDLDPGPDIASHVDDRLAERLLARLMGAVVAAARSGERIVIGAAATTDVVLIDITRPAAFADRDMAALMQIEADGEEADSGAALLGVGFALRLSRNLARELGGDLVLGRDCLTLRLPAAVNDGVGQATN